MGQSYTVRDTDTFHGTSSILSVNTIAQLLLNHSGDQVSTLLRPILRYLIYF